jgi:lipid II:glycine glycyltransferase (peptidoglycan interpeptide bridge formation enzyme)
MMLEPISFDDDHQTRAWDAFVESHPKGTPYHMSGWLKAINETYPFKPASYVWRIENVILGIFPAFLVKNFLSGSRLISVPFSDYGGPLFSDESMAQKALQHLLQEYKEKTKSIEIRGNVPDGSGFVSLNYYKSHILDLQQGLPVLMKKIDKRTTQYSIRKAEKAGFEIRERNDEQGMEEFYRLNLLTRRKHGVPTQPKKFFENLFRYLILKGHGYLLLSYDKSKVVGGSLFLTCGKRMHYKYNASDPEILGKITPNHALTWHAIKKGCDEGYHTLDFGRTSPDNEGLMRYKATWGNMVLDAIYYYYPEVKGASSMQEDTRIYKALTRIWRQLPASIVEIIGPRIYRYMA